MAERKFVVAIVGKRNPRRIPLGTDMDFVDFISLVKSEFGLAPGEVNALKLHCVGEMPNDENASGLFDESADRVIMSSAELMAGDVKFIVGKIGEPAGDERARGDELACAILSSTRFDSRLHSFSLHSAGAAAAGGAGGELPWARVAAEHVDVLRVPPTCKCAILTRARRSVSSHRIAYPLLQATRRY